MKNRWPSKTLAETCLIKPPKAEARDKLSDSALVSFLPMEAMGIDQMLVTPNQTRPLSEVTGSYTYFAEGDVLLAKITPCFENGKLGIASNLKNGVGFGSSEYIVFRPNTLVSKEWLYYFLSREAFRVEGAAQMSGAVGHKRVAKEFIEAYPIPVPPMDEQQRIVGVLDEAFAGLATAQANARKNLLNARALFESHLQSVFSQRGEGWERMVPLSSVLSVQPRNGWSPPMEYQTGTGTPVLTLSSVTGFEYDGSKVKLSSAPTRDDAHYWLQDGELLLTRSNTQQLVGHVAIYDGTPRKAICCDLIMKMQVDANKALTRFVYFYLRSPAARSYLMSRAQGASSTMKKIGKPVVQNIPVPLPSRAQQKKAIELLDSIREETQCLESLYTQKLAALSALKKSLLHQAFSGQL